MQGPQHTEQVDRFSPLSLVNSRVKSHISKFKANQCFKGNHQINLFLFESPWKLSGGTFDKSQGSLFIKTVQDDFVSLYCFKSIHTYSSSEYLKSSLKRYHFSICENLFVLNLSFQDSCIVSNDDQLVVSAISGACRIQKLTRRYCCTCTGEENWLVCFPQVRLHTLSVLSYTCHITGIYKLIH